MVDPWGRILADHRQRLARAWNTHDDPLSLAVFFEDARTLEIVLEELARQERAKADNGGKTA